MENLLYAEAKTDCDFCQEMPKLVGDDVGVVLFYDSRDVHMKLCRHNIAPHIKYVAAHFVHPSPVI
jgi:hypothetical protein